MVNNPPGTQNQEQARPGPLLEPEVAALRTRLRHAEELLQSRGMELATRDELITLLRQQIEGLERSALPLRIQELERPAKEDLREEDLSKLTAEGRAQESPAFTPFVFAPSSFGVAEGG